MMATTNVLYWPLRAVWQNIGMAEWFIRAAKNPEPGAARFYYIVAAAGGLWSAIDIYIHKVEARHKKASAKYPELKGSASRWFDRNERLVNWIRHGRVHYGEPVETATSFTPGGEPESITWVITVRGKHLETTPIDEVITRMGAACERARDLIRAQTGEERVVFM